ncbi:MAG: hypothetical protein LBC18_09150, partial [Opitutaceae bacterium]|nr:hypothetical protein [Opitutaceae bacterium]
TSATSTPPATTSAPPATGTTGGTSGATGAPPATPAANRTTGAPPSKAATCATDAAGGAPPAPLATSTAGDTTTAAAAATAADAADATLPPLAGSLAGPLIAIGLLALRPACGITVDPLVALPAGGLAGILCTRRLRKLGESLAFGLEKMSLVAVLLVGTGTIAGVIKSSSLRDWILGSLNSAGLGESLIAPVSGALMSAATASTTAGATIASSSFAAVILAAGVSAAGGAAMINAGATMLDHLPHGSFFHASAGSMQIDLKDRLKLIPYETLIGGFLALFSTLSCLLLNIS